MSRVLQQLLVTSHTELLNSTKLPNLENGTLTTSTFASSPGNIQNLGAKEQAKIEI